MKTDKKQNYLAQRLTIAKLNEILEDKNVDSSTKELITIQYVGAFRVGELIQLWEIIFSIGKQYDELTIENRKNLLNSSITFKDKTEGIQSFEYLFTIKELFTQEQIESTINFMGANKPLKRSAITNKYAKVGIQTHAVRRGAADEMWYELTRNNQNRGEAIYILQSLLRHKNVASTEKYILEIEKRDFRDTAISVQKQISGRIKSWKN